MDAKNGTKKFRSFVFTTNNPAEGWMGNLERLFEQGYFKYAVVGREEGKGGTPHLQGYIELTKRSRMGAVKGLAPFLNRAHMESRRGTAQQAADYCKKDGDFVEYGDLPKNQGKRSDLDRLRELVNEEGITDKLELMNSCDAAFRYPQAVDTFVKLSKKAKLAPLILTLKPWQQSLATYLQNQDPHPRKILWYWDPMGATGKTTMARWLMRNEGAFYCTGGKTADIAHAYDEERIVVFDFARSLAEHINYQVIENLKNGMIFSGKYNSCMKDFDVPHLIVFANFEPDYNKLSKDRWDVKQLD